MKTRGFEVAKGWEDKDIHLPKRSTKFSAGYDIEAAEDVIIPPFKKGDSPTLVKTGLKAYMEDDEVLYIFDRSSNPKKRGVVMANSVGIIDKDYYGNPENDGHFMILFYNTRDEDVLIKKGEAIAQGIFQKYLVVDNDNAIGERSSGFGSTDKQA